MRIKDINKNDLPRERLFKLGAEALSDSELLAIMIGVGSKEESVLDLSNRLIKEYGLSRLFNMSYEEITKIKGIKSSKASKLLACFELARRASKIENLKSIKTKKDLFEFIISDFLFYKFERLGVYYFDSKLRCLGKDIYNGSNTFAYIPIKDICQNAFNKNAYGVVFVHNHPSGDVTPSKADIESTIKYEKILSELGIVLLEHLIVSDNNYLSIIDELNLYKLNK